MKQKALVLYSGGLDSRLVLALLKKKYKVEALHFNLPFGCGCSNLSCNFNFTQMQDVKLTIKDVTKSKLLKQYLEIMKNPKHGIGKGINPCKDCKIWMFKLAKKYADKNNIKYIATGEVLGQRPMSQTKRAMQIIDKEIGFKIHRPLIDLGFQGRKRDKQMKLAKKLKIKYPSPGGGCLLCERTMKKRFQFLLENNLIDDKTLKLTNIGRHFAIPFNKKTLKHLDKTPAKDLLNSKFSKNKQTKFANIAEGNWFIVGRNEQENNILEKSTNSIKSGKGKPAVYFHKKSTKKKAQELQKAYQLKKPNKFIKYKL